jgi:hypothetical protein
MLDLYNKKNLRSLANAESDELEQTKTKILFGLKPYSKITEDSIKEAFAQISNNSLSTKLNEFKSYAGEISRDLDRDLTVDENKQVKASFYSMVYSQE